MKVLLSIKPEFVAEIVNGRKQFEYRKSIFKRNDIESVVVYSTMPYGKIIGEFKIGEIIEDSPESLWELTCDSSGISENFFFDYFANKARGFAIKIEEFFEYEKPLALDEYRESLKTPPQSFCYID